MHRNNSSSYNNRREDRDGDDDSYSSGSQCSDEQPDDYEDSRPPQNNGRRPDRRPQPQETQSNPEASVSFFSGASGFEINGGSFTNIGGNVYNGGPAHTTPWSTPHRPSVPRSKTSTSYFSNATQFKINNGAFTSVAGDMYSPVHGNINGPNQGYPPRGPQIPRSQPQYDAPPNRDYPPDNAAPSGRRETGARRGPRRQTDTSSHMQNDSFLPNQSHSRSNSTQPSFPSPQFADDRSGTAYPQSLGHEPPSHSPPPSSTLPLSTRNVEPRDQASLSADRAAPNALPSTGTLPTELTEPNSLYPPAVPTSVSASQSFPRFSSTMIAEATMDFEQESPAIIRGPAGNRDNVASEPSASTSFDMPQLSSPAANRTGKNWMKFGKKSEKDKEKK